MHAVNNATSTVYNIATVVSAINEMSVGTTLLVSNVFFLQKFIA